MTAVAFGRKMNDNGNAVAIRTTTSADLRNFLLTDVLEWTGETAKRLNLILMLQR